MNTTTIIEPFKFQLINNKLTVFQKEDNQEVLTFEPLKPEKDELESKEISLSDFFNLEISLLLREELKLNDLQVQVFRNFLEEANFFTN